MNAEREDWVRIRAYEIWESEGRSEGREQEHWEQACKEFDGEGPSDKPIAMEATATAGDLSSELQPGGANPGADSQADKEGVGAAGRDTPRRASRSVRRPSR